jgi:alkylation response protein AidB-like acyl-CoA dehydrogenase
MTPLGVVTMTPCCPTLGRVSEKIAGGSDGAVSLRREGAGPLPRLAAERARSAVLEGAALEGAGPDLIDAMQVAQELGPLLPLPTQGDTLTLWESLASVGAVDLTVARVVEPHLDALSILREARRDGRICDEDWRQHSSSWSAGRLWQVYAAEGAERVTATPRDDGTCLLNGTKSWCSLADRASHALVTAWVDDTRRGLFAVDLSHPAVGPPDDTGSGGQSTTWAARGLARVRSTAIRFDAMPAIPIGEPLWYLTRPGFAWGGVGVAAIWYGAAVALARSLRSAGGRREPDQVALVHLGAADTALARARAVLAEAAEVADDDETSPEEAVLVSQRARQVVADTAEEVVARVGHALGPAPLTGDEDHARRVADLTVYVRQHHGERDLARQGEQVLAGHPGWQWW